MNNMVAFKKYSLDEQAELVNEMRDWIFENAINKLNIEERQLDAMTDQELIDILDTHFEYGGFDGFLVSCQDMIDETRYWNQAAHPRGSIYGESCGDRK